MRLSFFLGEAFESLKRNWVMTIASVMTVFITMTILGLVMVTDRNLNHGATSLKNRVEIEIFISDKATPDQVAALQHKIAAANGHCLDCPGFMEPVSAARSETRFVPREQAKLESMGWMEVAA